MKRSAVYGIGTGINGREAGMQATQRALDQLGASRPALALVFISEEYNAADVVSGLTPLLGDTPLWGFSTIRPLTCEGDQPRTVVVALIAGSELKAQVQWWPNYSQEAAGVTRQALQAVRQESFLAQDLLFVADGINANLEPLCTALGETQFGVSGCMASGEAALGKTVQVGKNQCGPGSLSIAVLGGRFKMGVGMAHGWQPVGAYFRATRTNDVWVQALDGAPAVEAYSRYFGYSARDWAAPPLSEMARLYPLGVEMNSLAYPMPAGSAPEAAAGLLLRSPLRMEIDGSLRMSAPVPEGAVVHLMVGDPNGCLEAAKNAAQAALQSFHASRGATAPLSKRSSAPAKPALAVVMVDVAWQYLFETHPNLVSQALKTVLGDIPLVGAYTLGQVFRPRSRTAPLIQNQNLAVVILGEASD
jgi:hypothetical protein